MKSKSSTKNSVLVFILGLVVFAAGYFTAPVSACTRINATCSYQVTNWFCLYDPCGTCAEYGMPCCYKETGYCLDNPGKQTYSQICYGLCGF